jgi:hypothetical protein
MIVEKNINPEHDHYFLGACIIEILDRNKTSEIDFVELYNKIKNKQTISFRLYVLTLDWLFMLGAIVLGDSGGIKKCF